tara:strand:- start:571 stop:1020 length:450 start_codon:yes stop_codon:yes gene_type:complete
MVVFKTVAKILKTASRSVRKAVKDVTGLKVGTRVSKLADTTLNHLGTFVGKVPLVGGKVAYIFRAAGEGIKIVIAPVDLVIEGAGKGINAALKSVIGVAVYGLTAVSRGLGFTKKKKKKGKKRTKKKGRKKKSRRKRKKRGGSRRRRRR